MASERARRHPGPAPEVDGIGVAQFQIAKIVRDGLSRRGGPHYPLTRASSLRGQLRQIRSLSTYHFPPTTEKTIRCGLQTADALMGEICDSLRLHGSASRSPSPMLWNDLGPHLRGCSIRRPWRCGSRNRSDASSLPGRPRGPFPPLRLPPSPGPSMQAIPPACRTNRHPAGGRVSLLSQPSWRALPRLSDAISIVSSARPRGPGTTSGDPRPRAACGGGSPFPALPEHSSVSSSASYRRRDPTGSSRRLG